MRFAMLVGLWLLSAAWPAAAQGSAAPAVRQVLLLQSFQRGSLTVDSFTGNFRVDLDQRSPVTVNLVQIAVGPTGFVGASDEKVLEFIRSTYAGHPQPDLIVTLAGPAAVFARKYRAQLFPDTPLLFASVDRRFLRNALGANEMAVPVSNDFPGLVADILQVRPQTSQVFMVTGSGQLGRFWRRELEEPSKRFAGRVSFVWSDELSLSDILRRAGGLPGDAAILYLTFGVDALGGAYADDRVLRELHAAATAPIFGISSPLIGHGIVGGRLMSIEDLSRNTAEVAARILDGAPLASIAAPPDPPRLAIFDWRELQRWGIPESRLPPGSAVRYRPPTLWQQYRYTVLGVSLGLLIQSLLIVGLLYQRRARQRAEAESRTNLALAADVSRRETMAALTNSITHELGQPLGSMLSNAHALQKMVSANQATLDGLTEILSDIRAQGVQATQIIERHRAMLGARPLERAAIDLRTVINQSLALLAHDLRQRQIAVNAELSYVPCITMADQVLLQQVLVNVLINAMDAMADSPPARRQLTIRTETRAADVEVSVRDNGIGLPADSMLFTPFVTTKSQGLGIGLTIAQTIVHAYGGTIDGRNNPQGGATFTVTFPRSGPDVVPAGAA